MRWRNWFSKAKRHQVLKPLSLELKQGQTIGVIGESGSGKTTLAMAILGLLGETTAKVEGDVSVLDQPWLSLRPIERRAMRSFKLCRRVWMFINRICHMMNVRVEW